jgi:hypothetical protein
LLKALVVMIVRHLHRLGDLLAVLEGPLPEMRIIPALLSESELPPTVRFVLGDLHSNAPTVRTRCEQDGRCLVTTQYGPYPHTHAGVEVRRVFHKLRSANLEAFNELFKAIFDGRGSVPTKGLRNTQRFALGAVLVYQLALLARFKDGLALRLGLKAFLKGA